MSIPWPAYDLILVRWWDHTGGCYRWTDIDDAKRVHGAVLVSTCGFVIKEDKKYLTIVFCVANLRDQSDGKWADDVSSVQCIIKKCIETRTMIRKGRKP